MRHTFARWMISAFLAVATLRAHAWPDRPVRIIVGFSAGGVADLAARVLAEQLQRKYGQAVTVENKAGAGGRLATDAVAKAVSDGYTLGLLVGGDTVVAASDPNLPYHLLKDFQFVSTLSVYPFVLAAGPESKTPSIARLLETARRSPGSVSYATPGRGTTQHLAGELIASVGKVDLTDVPYRGAAAAMTDVLGSRVDFTITTLNLVRADLQSGKLKALGVTSRERLATLPDVPSLAEVMPGYEVTTWMGIAAPARTPQAIVDQLNRDVREVMSQPAGRDRFIVLGLEPLAGSSAEMRARVEGDITRWKQLITDRKLDLTK